MFDQLWPLAGAAFMGQPVLVWCGFLVLVAGLLAFDLRILNRRDHTIGFWESVRTTAFYVAVALAFGGAVWELKGVEAGMLYLTAFLVERSPSLDNVFVISTVFAAFAVPPKYQHRVLLWGILGAIVMRGAMIVLGAAMIARFHWILFGFGGFLVLTGIRMLFGAEDAPDHPDGSRLVSLVRRLIPVTPEFHGHDFFAVVAVAGGTMRRVATPLFPALVVVELADVLFAVDSIPAVLSITGDTFIVFSSNIFAILGLRALYSVLAVTVLLLGGSIAASLLRRPVPDAGQ